MKYIVSWNAGYGLSSEVIDADSQAKAEVYAYEAWREDVESQAVYSAIEYSDEEWEDMQ